MLGMLPEVREARPELVAEMYPVDFDHYRDPRGKRYQSLVEREPNGFIDQYVWLGSSYRRARNLRDWAESRERRDYVILKTRLPGGRELSTVFLGLDHGWGEDDRRPVLFESMIFPACNWQDRYCTLREAWTGHWNCVAENGGAEGRWYLAGTPVVT